MQEGPVNTAPPANLAIPQTLTQPVKPLAPSQVSLVPDATRLDAPHQRVRVKNTDPLQTHILVDRFLHGHTLAPGQEAEVDMVNTEIEAFRNLARADRGVYRSGYKAGQPLPPHPLRFLDIPEAPRQEEQRHGRK